ncbi:OmpA family protein [Neolewinella persica]|uniref:OmpA family protein n=1 Tax=Neolewinella persica TaxID=70998 RepID=UPI000376B1B3|nr:OmpA family protein [Neolewinella persica]
MLRATTTLILLFCLLSAIMTAQKGSDFAAANAAFDDGVKALLDAKPKKARKSFQEAVQLDTGYVAARRFLGVSEELLGNFTGAARAYQQVLRQDSTFSRLLYYQLGQMYYKMSRPSLALYYFEKFEALQSRDRNDFGRNGEEEAAEEQKVLKKLAGQIKAAKITRDSTQFINVTELYNLGFPINTRQNDYFPFFSNNMNSVLFTRQGELGDEDLLVGRRKDRESEFVTSRFGTFNTTQPEGTCSLVRDGERIYFTLCKEDKDQTAKGGRPVRECDLYAGWLIKGQIRDVEPLPDYISTPGYWETQATISCDEQQLFFVSNRPGGFGGTDIYVCDREEDGSWGKPRNLGEGVNTPEDEEAPFLSNDGQTLYFSSTGHYSLGDEDIFASWWDSSQQRFTSALNLGPPVNGPHRELGFHLSSDGKTGFVASDRPGGWGKLDIYGFKLSDRLSSNPVTYVSGFITDSLTGEPIINQAVPVTGGNTYYTNYEGRFFICAPAHAALPLTVDHPDYLPYSRDFAIPDWDNLAPYRIDLFMAAEAKPPPPPVIEPPAPEPQDTIEPDTIQRRARIVKRNYTVRFNFEDASLTPRAIQGLEIFVNEIKDKNIQSISVTGFTDDIGATALNVRLSQNRAKAVGVHLQTAGVKATEISIKGMGELPGSSARALNRKVEVTVRYRELVEIK